MSAAATRAAAAAGALRALAAWQYRGAVRSRWVVIMAAIYGLLSVTVTLLAFRSVRELGLVGIGPTAATLINVGVLLPSLIGLLLGAGAIVGPREDGSLAMVAAQPIGRATIVWASFLGLTGAIWTALGIGLGAAMVVISGVARAADLPAIAALVAATLGVAATGVAIGLAASAIASSRAQAVAAAVAMWIVFALGVDLALAAIAPSLRIGPQMLLVAILLNPLESARILALLGADLEGTALGPFGAYAIGAFGARGTIALLFVELIAWTVLALVVARWALHRRDL